MDQTSAAPVSRQDHEEEMVGTWLVLAILTDELVEAGLINRDSILATLGDAEDRCRGVDRRHRAIRAVRRTIEALASSPSEAPQIRRGRSSGGRQPKNTQAITAAE